MSLKLYCDECGDEVKAYINISEGEIRVVRCKCEDEKTDKVKEEEEL